MEPDGCNPFLIGETPIFPSKMKLPTKYSKLKASNRRGVRDAYIKLQGGKCWYCGKDLAGLPPKEILSKPINLLIFPKGFLQAPIHLQHDHNTDLTEGVVHAYCNAVLWQYYKR